MDVADGCIQGIVLVLARGNGYRGLVAPEDDGHERGALTVSVLGDDVLQRTVSTS